MTTPETPASVDGGPEPIPCPWGHPADVTELGELVDEPRWFVSCAADHAACPAHPMTEYYETRAEAIAAWNTRPSTRDAHLIDEVEARAVTHYRGAVVCRWCRVNLVEYSTHDPDCAVTVIRALAAAPNEQRDAALREEGRVQERADVVAWYRRRAEDKRAEVARIQKREIQERQTSGTTYDRLERAEARAFFFDNEADCIERGDHIQPPAPAIPQSGDEKEGAR
jgi:hypothetical protein